MSEETSKKFKSGSVEGTVTFRKSKKSSKRVTLPITQKYLELHPERAHWTERHKKKEGEK